jgi:hypothetical protein
MKVDVLCVYMKARAAFEGVACKLNRAYVQARFDEGCRSFFGVTVDDRGKLLRDEQQTDFFKNYHLN